METFSALLAICAGNSPVPVNSPHKGQWRGVLMFSLICVWINGWVNNREAGDLRCHRGHCNALRTYNALMCWLWLEIEWTVQANRLWEVTLHWRHNGHDGVSNHQPHGCLLNCLFRRGSKKTPKLRVTGLCVGKSPGPVNSPHKGPVTRKMFPFDNVIMELALWRLPIPGYSQSQCHLRKKEHVAKYPEGGCSLETSQTGNWHSGSHAISSYIPHSLQFLWYNFSQVPQL